MLTGQIPDMLPRVMRGVRCRRARRTSHRVYLLHVPGHVEDRWGRITLFAEDAVAIVMRMIFTHIVFTAERVFKVARAFVNRGAFRPTTLSIVHTGSHFSLAFDYGPKTTTNLSTMYMNRRTFCQVLWTTPGSVTHRGAVALRGWISHPSLVASRTALMPQWSGTGWASRMSKQDRQVR
jgi:hypothetical protein